jgi:Rha family phage regulatory protein
MNARFQPPAIPVETRAPILPVIEMHGGVPMAHSRHVARYFAKEHKAVLRAYRDAKCSPEFRQRNFAPCILKGLDGKEYTDHVLMTKSGFAFVVLAFTGDKAAPFREDYINAYDRMEADLRAKQPVVVDPMAYLTDPRNVLQVLGQMAQRTIELEGQLVIAHGTIEEQAPAVEALEAIAEADGTYCISDTAKHLSCRPSDLYRYLRSNEAKVRWLFQRSKGDEDVAVQDRLNAGELVERVRTVTRPDGTEKLVTRIRVTPRGLTRLARIIAEGKDDLAPKRIPMAARARDLFD